MAARASALIATCAALTRAQAGLPGKTNCLDCVHVGQGFADAVHSSAGGSCAHSGLTTGCRSSVRNDPQLRSSSRCGQHGDESGAQTLSKSEDAQPSRLRRGTFANPVLVDPRSQSQVCPKPSMNVTLRFRGSPPASQVSAACRCSCLASSATC